MEEDDNNRQNTDAGLSFPKCIAAGIIAGVILILALLYFFRPQAAESIVFNAIRIKNTISYYVFHSSIHFYYLEMEKKRQRCARACQSAPGNNLP